MEEEIDKNNGRDMTPKLIKDLGMRYPTEKSKYKSRYGLYECQYCGKEWETLTNHINSKSTKGCGCQAGRAFKHGLRSNKFYPIWNAMLQRCVNPLHKRFKDYGGRGITLCEEWLDVANFVAWAESTHPNIEGMSLDRIDNDKGYSPENCRWADETTQCLNQRMRKSNTSGYVGVAQRKDNGKWTASITKNYKIIALGCYKTLEEAVQARDNYIIENGLPHKLSTDYAKETKCE